MAWHRLRVLVMAGVGLGGACGGDGSDRLVAAARDAGEALVDAGLCDGLREFEFEGVDLISGSFVGPMFECGTADVGTVVLTAYDSEDDLRAGETGGLGFLEAVAGDAARDAALLQLPTNIAVRPGWPVSAAETAAAETNWLRRAQERLGGTVVTLRELGA